MPKILEPSTRTGVNGQECRERGVRNCLSADPVQTVFITMKQYISDLIGQDTSSQIHSKTSIKDGRECDRKLI